MDCGYGYNGMINGCNGAAPHGELDIVRYVDVDNYLQVTRRGWPPRSRTWPARPRTRTSKLWAPAPPPTPSSSKVRKQQIYQYQHTSRYVVHNTAGASITGGYWTEQGGEDLLKKLVAEHGAVMTGVAAAGPFSEYKVSCDWSRPRSADP